jgi:hypothetical protein
MAPFASLIPNSIAILSHLEGGTIPLFDLFLIFILPYLILRMEGVLIKKLKHAGMRERFFALGVFSERRLVLVGLPVPPVHKK